MAELTGSEILAKCLKAEGVKDAFYIMGGPMLLAESSMINEGIRMIDVRHEQAAAFSAQAYSRLTQKPGICMAASGPAAINLSTGLANALIDCCPVIGFGGASPISQFGRQVFQEIDQMAIMRGCVKYADRIHNVKRIPQQINFAFQKAMTGKPGPVYLDWPGDVLYQKVEESQVDWSYAGRPIVHARPYAEPKAINALVDAINKAERPIIASGGGVIWSQAWNEMRGCREGRHPVLHDPARPRRRARRPPVFLSDDAQRRVSRGRSDHHSRHADELCHRPRRTAALQQGRDDCTDRDRPRRARHLGAQC